MPVDGIGHQMHNNVDFPSAAAVLETVNLFAGAGLDNQVTELDVSVYSNSFPGPVVAYEDIPADRFVRQAFRYRDFFQAFRYLSDKISSVTFWGQADDHTWLTSSGRVNGPLLFDTSLLHKPAYTALVDPSQLPGAGSTAVFSGAYRVAPPGTGSRPTAAASFSLSNNGPSGTLSFNFNNPSTRVRFESASIITYYRSVLGGRKRGGLHGRGELQQPARLHPDRTGPRRRPRGLGAGHGLHHHSHADRHARLLELRTGVGGRRGDHAVGVAAIESGHGGRPAREPPPRRPRRAGAGLRLRRGINARRVNSKRTGGTIMRDSFQPDLGRREVLRLGAASTVAASTVGRVLGSSEPDAGPHSGEPALPIRPLLHTPLCDLLGIRYPLLQAPMARVVTPEMIAEVARAGGPRNLRGHGRARRKICASRYAASRRPTNRPYGVNLILHPSVRTPVKPAEIPESTMQAIQRALNPFRERLGVPAGRAAGPRHPRDPGRGVRRDSRGAGAGLQRGRGQALARHDRSLPSPGHKGRLDGGHGARTRSRSPPWGWT